MDKTEAALQRLRPDAQPTALEFFNNEKDNTFINHLLHTLLPRQATFHELLEYGLQQLAKASAPRKNYPLSAYFFLLSELADVPDEARDFALDVSVYCEGAFEYSNYYRALDPHSAYLKEIESLLRRSGS